MTNLKLVSSRDGNVTVDEFLEVIFEPQNMHDDEAICLSYTDSGGGFRNHSPARGLAKKVISADSSYYYCVSSVLPKKEGDRFLRRGREQARFAYVVGLDDIGTKAQAPNLEPSYKIETSPDNFQWGYLIDPYELDGPNGEKTCYYEACIQALVDAGMSDPGAVGCYRLFRVPGSINTKAEHNGFRAHVTFWDPQRIWVLSELMDTLGLKPVYKGKVAPVPIRALGAQNASEDDPVLLWLNDNGDVYQEREDFYQIRCPWADEHTDGKDSAEYSPLGSGGAEYTDARQFHCFHAHCAHREIDEFLTYVRASGGPDVSSRFNMSLESALAAISDLMGKDDAGVWFEVETIQTLRVIKGLSNANYQRIRAQLKKKGDVSITELERELRKENDQFDVVLTHHGIAKALVTDCTIADQAQPVACYGTLFRYRGGIWAPLSFKDVSNYVACSRYDSESVCRLGSHYKSIAELILNLCTNKKFFSSAPKGVAAGETFYLMADEGEVKQEPLNSEHRCRFKLPVEPSAMETPLFNQLIEAAFKSDLPKESAEQVAVLQEVFGGVLLGLIAPLQKAVVFYGATRAGKGVLVDIIQAMLPKDAISSVSPFKWSSDYHIADMAGKRLNLCGEFPEDNQLPAAMFKQVIGGDPVSGRLPYQEVFTFRVDSSQLFSCNYLPFCREQSESFYNRWQVVSFPNTVPAEQRDPKLAKKIIESEMAGILNWALEGAARLLKQDRFSASNAHERTMREWRLRSDSVAAFMEVIGFKLLRQYKQKHNSSMPTSLFYDEYELYCNQERTKPVGKKTCFERIRSIDGVAIKHFEDGDKVVML